MRTAINSINLSELPDMAGEAVQLYLEAVRAFQQGRAAEATIQFRAALELFKACAGADSPAANQPSPHC